MPLGYPKFNRKRCVACGSCMKACKYKNIKIVGGMYAVADIKKCMGCDFCKRACPADVIEMVFDEGK